MPDGNTRRDRFATEARDDVTTFCICERSEAICPLSVILSVSEESYWGGNSLLDTSASYFFILQWTQIT